MALARVGAWLALALVQVENVTVPLFLGRRNEPLFYGLYLFHCKHKGSREDTAEARQMRRSRQ